MSGMHLWPLVTNRDQGKGLEVKGKGGGHWEHEHGRIPWTSVALAASSATSTGK